MAAFSSVRLYGCQDRKLPCLSDPDDFSKSKREGLHASERFEPRMYTWNDSTNWVPVPPSQKSGSSSEVTQGEENVFRAVMGCCHQL